MSLAEAMIKIYHLSSDELAAMGAYSREKALSTFDIRIIAKHYLQLIRNIFSNQSKSKKKKNSKSVFHSQKARKN